jgi:hypothetical protein
MNTLTGAWCQFVGWNANCFELFNNNLYFGDNFGNVAFAYQGGSDLFNTINADMQCAFNYFDDPGRIKRMTMVQPLVTVSQPTTLAIGVDTDFGTSTTSAPVSNFSFTGSLWDVGLWDVAQWSGGIINETSFFSVNALGHAMALRIKLNFASGAANPGMNGTFDLGVFDNAVFDSGIFSTSAPVVKINLFNSILELGGLL